MGRGRKLIVQVREPGDLSLEAQSSLTFFLCKLQLASFIVPNIRHAYLAAEAAKNLVLGRIHDRRKVLKLFAYFIERVS
jgi:hypothetical protein